MGVFSKAPAHGGRLSTKILKMKKDEIKKEGLIII